jgi:hypothetical protein
MEPNSRGETPAARALRLAPAAQQRATARRLRAEADQPDGLATALGGTHPPTEDGPFINGNAQLPHGAPQAASFTAGGQAALQLAADEAQRFNHTLVGTEHLLLGSTNQSDNARCALNDLGVDLLKTQHAVECIIGRGDRTVPGVIALAPRAKKVIALAGDEARRLHHPRVAPAHLLLGIVREREGIAAGVLQSLGVTLETARAAMLANLKDHPDDAE